MIFSVILDALFTLGPFSRWKWNRNFVWEQQPEVYLQRVNKEWFCYGLWLIMIDSKIFWFQMISTCTISWLIKCMLSIWRLNLFIKRHVSLKVNIYYSRYFLICYKKSYVHSVSARLWNLQDNCQFDQNFFRTFAFISKLIFIKLLKPVPSWITGTCMQCSPIQAKRAIFFSLVSMKSPYYRP
jgi:hypothetical protein